MLIIYKIHNAINKFNLELKGKNVLTEAATGNFVVTPIIAALAGANVYAYTKNSKYGTISEVKKQTYDLGSQLNINDMIQIITDIYEIDLKKIDILTNTGFLRPIKRSIIEKLSPKCVIPLMWESWEYRKDELDLDACYEKGIKVYGTNESDSRLKTMDYIGYIVLYFLLKNKLSPFSANVLVIGCKKFVEPIVNCLNQNNYSYKKITNYDRKVENLNEFNVIIIAENKSPKIIIGKYKNSYIELNSLSDVKLIIHIAGNIDIKGKNIKCEPKEPKKFPYMSFTTDYIDNQAVIDLHTAGLKVAEGMLEANRLNLPKKEYKNFMESNYPALAFNNAEFF